MSEITLTTSQYLKEQYALLDKALESNIEAHLKAATLDDLDKIVKSCASHWFTHFAYGNVLRLMFIHTLAPDGEIGLVFNTPDNEFLFSVSDMERDDKMKLLITIEQAV